MIVDDLVTIKSAPTEVTARGYEAHQEKECNYRANKGFSCPRGCGEDVFNNTVESHMAVCPYRAGAPFPCLRGCGELVTGLVERFDIEPFSDFSAK